MPAVTIARVFQSGNSQTVRLPKQFRFRSPAVEIYRRGDEVVLRESTATLEEAFDLLAGLSPDFFAGGRVGMSTITYGELVWGAQVSSKPKENSQRLRAFARLVPALELPAEAAELYGEIRAVLQREGAPIGPNDLWIAALAVERWPPTRSAIPLNRVLVSGCRSSSRAKPVVPVRWKKPTDVVTLRTHHEGESNMGIAERIYELVKALPESAAAEVLDFAEARRSPASAEITAAARRTAALALLDKHAGRFKASKFERADLHDRARLR